MFKNRRFTRKSVILLTLLLILLASTSLMLAQAKIQGGSTIPGGPAFVSIDASAFIPVLKDSQRDSGPNYELCAPGSGYDGNYFAPVALPDNATINKFVLYYYDSSETYNINATLYARVLSGTNGLSTLYVMAQSLSSGSLGYGAAEDTEIMYSEVDQQAYSYTIQVTIPNEDCGLLRVAGVRIDYGHPTYLPTLKK